MEVQDNSINRRQFIKTSTVTGMSAVTTSVMGCSINFNKNDMTTDSYYISQWETEINRTWTGQEFWANPIQDWRIHNGHLECTTAAPDRDFQHLTRQLNKRKESFFLKVRVGCLGKKLNEGKGSAGFQIGIRGPLNEYRNNLIHGRGIDVGFSKEGYLLIGSKKQAIILPDSSVILVLTGSVEETAYKLHLMAYDGDNKQFLGEVTTLEHTADTLSGNISLATNYISLENNNKHYHKRADSSRLEHPDIFDRFWFDKWELSGKKIDVYTENTFGPILFNQFTVSRRTMKMTVQMPPLEKGDSSTIILQIRSKKEKRQWKTVAEANIDQQAYCATFRVDNWNDSEDVSYRVVYQMKNKAEITKDYYWEGIIAHDPVEKPAINVADISCNHHDVFPNFHLVDNVKKLKPDLLAFTGDQYYEGSGGYGHAIETLDLSLLDMLRKWMMHGWTWRDLLKDTPSLCLPDDHDVYQGNIWGDGGRLNKSKAVYFDDRSGYKMSLPWINTVHRQQTAHHPDAYDPNPSVDGISNYYGDYILGRISFAILADRMYKSTPKSVMLEDHANRKDHILSNDFDLTSIDKPGLSLLGSKQETFLNDWSTDWLDVDMKAVISQTIFTAMATTHGSNRKRIRADLDTNGWPQSKRTSAVKLMQKAFAVHLAGDQHLPAVVQYGVDGYRDGPVAFAGPAVNVGYPRWWEPEIEGKNQWQNAAKYTGDFQDNFDHPLTVHAVGTAPAQPRTPVILNMQDKMSGIGLVRFNKKTSTITFECWSFLANAEEKNQQMPGWPVTVDMMDNFSPATKYYLPLIHVKGLKAPVFNVIDDTTGEVVYTIRKQSNTFQPFTPAKGLYSVIISDGERKMTRLSKQLSLRVNKQSITVSL